MKNKLLSPNDNCLEILSLGSRVKISANSILLPEINESLMKITFPKYSSFKLRKIRNDLADTNVNFQDILIKYEFIFPLDPGLIAKIIDFLKYRNDLPEIIPPFILYSYLSWMIIFHQTSDSSFLSTLLNGLNFISLTNEGNDITTIHNLAISSFYHAFTVFLKARKIDDFTQFISPLNDFFIFNNNMPDPAFDILWIVALEIIDQSVSPQKNIESDFFGIIDNLLQLHKDFPPHIALHILERSCFALRRLDFSALSFLQHCVSIIEDQTLLKFLPIIPLAFSECLENSPIITQVIPSNNQYAKVAKYSTIKISYQTVTQSTFNEEPLPQNVTFPPIVSWAKLINEKNLMIIKYISKILEDRPILSEKFIEDCYPFLTIASKSKHCYDIFAAFFLLFHLIVEKYPTILLPKNIVFNSVIFDPSITIFSHDFNEYANLNTIRTTAFNFIVRNTKPKLIKKIFLESVNTPLLYAELVHRLISYEDIYSKSEYISYLSYSLLDPMLHYQNCVNSYKSEVNIARTAILSFMHNTFSSQQNLSLFFSNKHFIQFILALLFEKPLRSQIIVYLYRFLTNADNIQNPITKDIINTLSIILSTEVYNLSEIENIELITSILEIVNDVLIEVPVFRHDFEQISSHLCHQLTQVPHNNAYQPLLNAAMKFFNHTTYIRNLKFDEIHSIEIAITNICGNEPDDEIANDLIHLFSSNNVINRPNLVYLYLQSFLNSKKLDNCLIKLNNMCLENLENCVSLHEGEIDLLLINYMDIWRVTGDIPMPTLKHALGLIQIISSHICTFAVVQKYIALLCPLEGRHFPYYNMEIINTLHSLIIKYAYSPKSFLPLVDDAEVTTSCPLASESAFCFWINPVSSNYQIQKTIMKITDGDLDFQLNMYGNLLIYNILSGEFKLIHDIERRLPLNRWTFVTFKFYNNNTLCVYLNETEVDKLELTSNFIFNRKQVNITINVSNPKNGNKVSQRITSLFGPFAFFNSISLKDIIILHRLSPTKFKCNNPTTGFIPVISRGRKFSIENLTNIQCQTNLKRVSTPPSFAEVLYNFVKVETLIPLFAQPDMKYKDNVSIDWFLSIVLTLFEEILTSNSDAQESFAIASGFLIISHLLKNSNEIHFTFKLFLSFYHLFEALTNYELKMQIFHYIIINFEIWLKASANDHLKILHKLSKIANKYRQAFIDTTNIKYFVTILQSLYYYEPIEDKVIFIMYRVRGEALNTTKCRGYLFNIMMKIADEKLSQNDIDSIVYSVTTCKDMKQVFDLLDFIIRLIHKKILLYNPSMNKLLNIIKHNIPKLTVKVIQVFTHFENIHEVIDELMLNFYQYLNSKQLLIKLVKLKNTDVIRLCSWIATNRNISFRTTSKLFTMILNFQKHHNYDNHPCYQNSTDEQELWTIILLFVKKTVKIQKLMVKYLVRSRSDNFIKLFSQIEYVSRIMWDDDEDLMRLLLNEMLENVNDANKSQIQTIITHFLFFRSTITNPALTQLFEESPFRSSIVLEYPSSYLGIDFSHPLSVCNFIESTTSQIRNYHFGFHLSSQGEWIDSELAVKAMIKLNISSEFNNLLSVLFISSNVKLPESNDAKSNDGKQFDLSSFAVFKYFSGQKDDYEIAKATYDFFESLHDAFSFEKVQFTSLSSNLEYHISSTLNHSWINEYKESSQKCAQLWSHFWRSMTISRAPWHSSLSVEFLQKTHFKRDQVYCYSYCPFKVRTNYKFDDHLHASFTRDSGNLQKAQQRMTRYLQRKSSSIDFNSQPISILNIEELDNVNTLRSSRDFSTDSLSSFKIKIILETRCDHITVKCAYKSTFKLYPDYISITHDDTNVMKIIDISSIVNVFLRTVLHHQTAIEIFTDVRHSYFIDFRDNKRFNNVIGTLKKVISPKIIQMSSFKQYFSEQSFTNDWCSGKISNFEYLMYLNIYSGRSFNCPSQYPYVPWIINDYNSEEIDLNDINIYRDLTKPIGAINENRLKDLMIKQKELTRLNIEPYLFSSGNVCPLSVFLWLIRLEPFTSLHIHVQGGRFDHAARIFYSVLDSFRLASSHLNDFRELIPEFYYMPEFLTNHDRFDLGKLNNIPVDDVELPKWAHNSPYEFVYTLRKAMESEYVSNHLNSWIDLIWGSKQKSEDNRYKNEMYSDIWSNNPCYEKNEDRRSSIEAILSQVGQIPPQLFSTDHPQRNLTNNEKKPKLDSFVCVDLDISGETLAVNIKDQDSNSVKFIILSSSGIFRVVIIQINDNNDNYLKNNIKTSQSLDLRVEMGKSSNDSQTKKVLSTTYTISDYHKKGNENNNNFIHFFISNDSSSELYCIGKDRSDLLKYKISQDSNSTIHSSVIFNNLSEIVGICNDGIWTAVAGKDAIIQLFKNNIYQNGPVHSIMSFCDSISCCDISSVFDTMACGTKDKSLLICSLSRGNVMNDIKLSEGFTIKKILITPAWGFILIYTESVKNSRIAHYISLYNINGKFIKGIEIDFVVSDWVSWRSESGFDYVLLSDEKGRLYMFEAFYLNVKRPFFRCSTPIVKVKYLVDKMIAVAVSFNGKVFFIPYVYI
ncbi:Beige/BEACH domain containing protein [Tritrichomonas foetus]|uniref:Beige/BEACH domain containing protein n=1 Tax=Tritrichomonas foetus TaxID=1144522 RepID=A0A1J4JAT3_9EUKA|nr:Beige/BEACH domain containing protein [Tritrichomonas foetus]|eukprot:OHS96264.1 Beige/BEACH domain containing protein [Tritrichomonas foetus]